MKLRQPFYKLPFTFDPSRLKKEALAFPESAWRPHPSGYEGNTALILIAAHGEENDDTKGPMRPTQHLANCPYMQQVLASFDTVIGRTRLMRLEAESDVLEHTDIAYYWRNRTRIHVPIVTDQSVKFWCEDNNVHMKAGDCWTFDNWRLHKVENPSNVTRIHLVIDTVGSASFWRMLRQVERNEREPQFVPFDLDKKDISVPIEHYESAPVMAPGEIDRNCEILVADLRARADNDAELIDDVEEALEEIRHAWRSIWVVDGADQTAWPSYQNVVQDALKLAQHLPPALRVASNGMTASSIIQSDFAFALDRSALPMAANANIPVRQARRAAGGGRRQGGGGQRRAQARRANQNQHRLASMFDRPVFIVAAPRSGSTLLFETLAQNRDFWTLGDEGHQQVESIQGLHPKAKKFASNRLTHLDASPQVIGALRGGFLRDARSADGTLLTSLTGEAVPETVRFLEKTPKNALRIPFLRAAFAGARFIFLHRNPRDNLSSLLDSWRSGRYVTYRGLPGWKGQPWSHLLIPDWRELNGKKLADIVAAQWLTTNRLILDDLTEVPDDHWCSIRHEDFIANPAKELRRLCTFAEVPFGARMEDASKAPLKPSKYTLTAPDPDKWKKNAPELKPVMASTKDLAEELSKLPR
ncbi:MAG: hypothetical protein GY791_20980 [Alphaproteobacteria bacterium]|nr:hypothetical protein [Alphaproteobacteria bacterium]